MVSALSYAIYIVGVNQSTLKNLATLPLTFYVLLFGLGLFLVRVDFGQSLHVADTWYLWGNLVALAIFPTAVSFLCTTQAIQYIVLKLLLCYQKSFFSFDGESGK